MGVPSISSENDDTQVYKQFVENESFKRFVGDMVYPLTSQ
jgi:type I restriction enzyme R subunit